MSHGRAEDLRVPTAALSDTAPALREPLADAVDVSGLIALLVEAAGGSETTLHDAMAESPVPAASPPEENAPDADHASDVQRLLGEIEQLVAQAADHAVPSAPEPAALPTPVTPAAVPRPVRAASGRTRKKELSAEARAKKAEARRRLAMLGLVLLMSSIVAPILAHTSPTHAYAIASDSMAPTMPIGSFVIAGPAEVHERDVVVYLSRYTGTYQVHRIVEERHDGANVSYIARGDANDAPDSVAVQPKDIRGVVKFNAPLVGYLWLMPAWLQATIFVTFTLAYLAIVFWDARGASGRRAVKGVAIAIGLVLLIALPFAAAGVGVSYPGSAHGVSIASDPIPYGFGTSNGTAVPAVISGNDHEANVTLDAPKLWKEVELWGCSAAGSSGGSCDLSVSSTTYTQPAGARATIDATSYDPEPTFFLEAAVSTAAGQNISVKLYNAATGAVVAGSQAGATGQTSVGLVRSAGFTLSGTTNYAFKAMVSGGTGHVWSVKILSYQEEPGKIVTSVRMATGSTSQAGQATAANSGLWTFDVDNFDGTLVTTFECVYMQQGLIVTAGNIMLVDTSTGGSVAQMAPGLTTDVETVKSVAATLTSGKTYRVDYLAGNLLAGFGTMILYHCRVVIAQSGGFTTTTNYYNHVGHQTSSGTAFQRAGFPVRFHMDSAYNWGRVWFEFTASTTQATPTVRWKDETAGATLAGTSTSVSATSRILYTTDDVTLNSVNGTYLMEIQHATNPQTVTVFAGFLVERVNIANGHTYDHALTATPKTGGCSAPWSFTLERVRSSTMSRMWNVTVWIESNGVSRSQIVYTGGGFAGGLEDPISVASGDPIYVVVYANPEKVVQPVPTTIEADLKGVCGGVRTVQQLSMTFT